MIIESAVTIYDPKNTASVARRHSQVVSQAVEKKGSLHSPTQASLPGTVINIGNDSSPSSSNSAIRKVAQVNLTEILQKDKVPATLISLINSDADYRALAEKLLTSKGYMKFLRFQEDDLPFPETVCSRLQIKNAKLKEYRVLLSRSSNEIAASKSCCRSSCCSDGQADCLLIAGAVMLIFLLYFPFEKYLDTYPTLLVLIAIARILVPAGTVVTKVYSMRDARKEKAALMEAEKMCIQAEKDLHSTTAQVKRILLRQNEKLHRRARHLIRDFKDATPFFDQTTEDRLGLLNSLYIKKKQREIMEVQAGLITHYVKEHLSHSIAVIEKEMKSFILIDDPTVQPRVLLRNFVQAASTISQTEGKPLIDTPMFSVYREYEFQQNEFIRNVRKVESSRINNMMPATIGNLLIIKIFPLSCGSVAPELETERKKAAAASQKTGKKGSRKRAFVV